jgi:hypothetical protein
MRDIENLVSEIRKRYLSIFSNHLKQSDGKKIITTDLWMFGLLDRNIGLLEAMPPIIRYRNLHALAPLLRVQLDGLLRVYALQLVSSPEELALHVMQGGQLRKFKNSEGQKLSDKFLVDSITAEIPWIDALYEKLCGWVHFSDSHIFLAAKEGAKKGSIEVGIGSYRQDVPDAMIEEAIDAIDGIHNVTAHIIESYFESRLHM